MYMYQFVFNINIYTRYNFVICLVLYVDRLIVSVFLLLFIYFLFLIVLSFLITIFSFIYIIRQL